MFCHRQNALTFITGSRVIFNDYETQQTGLAQLVEHWSPKPGVVSSSLSTRATRKELLKIHAPFPKTYKTHYNGKLY